MRQYLESIFQLGYTQYKGQGTGNGTDVQKSIRQYVVSPDFFAKTWI